jgi:hypothetical protein
MFANRPVHFRIEDSPLVSGSHSASVSGHRPFDFAQGKLSAVPYCLSILTEASKGRNYHRAVRLSGKCAVPARHTIFVSDATAESRTVPRRFPAVFFEEDLNRPQWLRSR